MSMRPFCLMLWRYEAFFTLMLAKNRLMIELDKPTWHYTKDELPEQGEECFCDTGDYHGYQTLTYCGISFYDRECEDFKVTRWARVSEIVIALNKNT